MRALLFLIFFFLSTSTYAQSSPGFSKGQVPTAEQWNGYFSGKQDYHGDPLPVANGGTGATTNGGALSSLGALPNVLPSANIYVGSGDNVAVGQPMTGDCTLSNVGVISCPISTGLPYVGTKAALAATDSTHFPNGVMRLGYTAAGDSPTVIYQPSNSACSLNAGNGDNGYQVKSADNKCWVATWQPAGMDVRIWGATCNSSDSSVALQAAVSAAATNGTGTILVSCPITLTTGNVSIPGGVRLSGAGPLWYPNMFVATGSGLGGASWPATAGPAINCTNTTNRCIIAAGMGIEIDHINFGNPQPAPAGSWSPTSYPFVIASQCNNGGQPAGGFNFHHLSFTSTSKAIQILGCANYSTTNWSTTSTRIDTIWCNPCIETGIAITLNDQPLMISHVEFAPLWYIGNAAYQAYLLAHSIGFDIQYAANTRFSDVEFFLNKIAVRITNGVIVNGFGTLTLGCQPCNFTQIYFNNVCQAVVAADTNKSTRVNLNMTNISVWGDQNSGCSANLPMFSLESNIATFMADNVQINEAVDTFLSIGCGTPGAGSCPGGADVSFAPRALLGKMFGTYASNGSHDQPFVKATSNAQLFFDGMVTAFVAPYPAGTGPTLAPGLDGTQGYPVGFISGGGINASEGSALLEGGGKCGSSSSTGCLTFFTPNGAQRGFAGVGTSSGINLKSSGAATSVFIGQDGAPAMQVGSDSGTLDINVNGLPTSCSSKATGTLRVNGVVVEACP